MARTRKITADEILDAAERVILRVGAAGISIDAVAQEAGISKSRVVYDHRSKSALLEALIDRRLNAEEQRVRASVQSNSDTSHPELFGRIAVAEKAPDDTDKAVCLAISAAVSSEEKLHDRMREWTRKDLADIGNGARPKAALIAYLALTGFCCTEYFNLYQWETESRLAILDSIREIYTTSPDET
jgi:AcrR family transcriptional regulator